MFIPATVFTHSPKRWPRTLAALLAAAALGSAQAQTKFERGRYLAQSIVACGNCHTPQGPNGALAGMELAGGLQIDVPQLFTAYSANITPHKTAGIGAWTDAQIIAAIREGKRPDGSLIGPPMPVALYRGLADSDVEALVAYLRSVPAVDNKPPKSVYKMPLPASYGPPVGAVPDVPRSDRVGYGRYLAGPAGHCIECHSSPGADGLPDFEKRLGAGGMSFTGPWGTSVAPSLLPTNLQRYSDAELKTIITTGLRPDGSRLKPPMGVPYYARLSAPDLDALVAYLRSLPRP